MNQKVKHVQMGDRCEKREGEKIKVHESGGEQRRLKYLE